MYFRLCSMRGTQKSQHNLRSLKTISASRGDGEGREGNGGKRIELEDEDCFYQTDPTQSNPLFTQPTSTSGYRLSLKQTEVLLISSVVNCNVDVDVGINTIKTTKHSVKRQ